MGLRDLYRELPPKHTANQHSHVRRYTNTGHEEAEGHPLRKTTEMTFACKKCRKAFRKDLTDFDEADSFCPYCDNNFMIPAETPETKQLDAIAEGTHEIRLPGSDEKILDSRMMRKEDIPQDLWDELDNI